MKEKKEYKERIGEGFKDEDNFYFLVDKNVSDSINTIEGIN